MELYKCEHCESELDSIGFYSLSSNVGVSLENGEQVSFYVCTNRDCKNRGVVLAVPIKPKED